MPRPASPRPRRLHLDLMVGEDLLLGPPAAIVDLLRLLNALAAMRGARTPPLAWQFSEPGGRAARRGAPGGGRGEGARVRRPDVLLVPGWQARNGPHLDALAARDAEGAARLSAVHAAGGHVVGLYTGIAMLGDAGRLDGRPAAVPWPFLTSVLRHAPKLVPAGEAAWTGQDRVWTADSPTLATEVVLQVLQALGLGSLTEAARTVVLHSPQRQRLSGALATALTHRAGPGTLERARRWLEDNVEQPYRLADVAQAAAMSPRSLLRHFRAAYGRTPLQWLHEQRITRARMLLETTYLPVEAVAERCGWRDAAMLREVFRRATGMTPAAYRERFRMRGSRRQWGRELQR